MLAGKRILLIIGGGIAAYKALDLIRRLRDRGASVTPVLTKAAQEFVTREVDDEMTRAADSLTGVNHKSLLQQHVQRDQGQVPTYVVLDEQGPDHSKCFHVAAVVGERMFDPAWGASKKAAEQGAAENALRQLAGQSQPSGEAPGSTTDPVPEA